MDIEYLRTSRKSYMIVKNADYIFENYELQMILHNEIPSLLNFQVIVGDGTVEYWYDVTGMQSLEKQFSVIKVGEKQLRYLLQNLVAVKNAMEEYLLDDRNISLAASMVYYDRFSDRIRFCYIPGLAEQEHSGIRELFEEILQYLDHSDPEAVRMGYDMYERSAESEFLVEDCLECLANHESRKEDWDTGKELFSEEAVSGDACTPDRDRIIYKESDTGRMSGLRDMEEALPLHLSGRDRSAFPETGEYQRNFEKKRGFWRKKGREKRRNPVNYSAFLDA